MKSKKQTQTRKLSRAEFDELTRPLLGLPVSRASRGYGSAVILDFGELGEEIHRRRDGTTRTAIRGEASVLIEWSWRIERVRSIELGSWSGNRKITNGVARLQGLNIVDISAEGRLPELTIQLSGKRWLHSFMTFESQPMWCLFLARKSENSQWITSENGHLYLSVKADN